MAEQNTGSRYEWREGRVENGHRWRWLYRDGIAVRVVCGRCEREPIEVMRTDMCSEPCSERIRV